MAKVLGVYWREFIGNSPIGESTGGILVKVHWTFANGESPICEIPIGELPVTRRIYSQLDLKFSDPDAGSINKRFSDLEPEANHSFNIQ